MLDPQALADLITPRHLLRSLLLAELDVGVPRELEMPGPIIDIEAAETDSTGAAIARTAISIWEEHIEEPPGQNFERIDNFIRGAEGLGWNTADARNWTRNAKYDRNDMFAWCGAFAAYVYGRHGLKHIMRKKHMSSTYRLWARTRGGRRRVKIDAIEPGDIVVVGDGHKAAGDHITIVVNIRDDGLIETIEGNARGLFPDDSVGEGVVRRTRPLPQRAGGPGASRDECPLSGLPQRMEVMWAYRMLPDDFE